MSYQSCGRTRSDKFISVEEKGKVFRISNPTQKPVFQVRVDNCLITGNRERCDFLFEVNGAGNACTDVVFVELKGRDIKKALSQLESTIKITNGRYRNITPLCYVVASSVPASNPAVTQAMIKFRRDLGAQLVVRTREATHQI
jgi:hypothetical protein